MKNSALVVIDLQNDITKKYKEIIEKSMRQSTGQFKISLQSQRAMH